MGVLRGELIGEPMTFMCSFWRGELGPGPISSSHLTRLFSKTLQIEHTV
jgi:hypothetical protein